MNIPRLTLGVIILLSLVGAAAITFSTRWGPWAYSDSTAYIVSARTLIEKGGLGYYVPSGGFERLIHHPPLYPLILSAIGLLGVELLAAARWLNILLFAATIFITGALTYRLLRSSWLSIILSAGVLVMPPLVEIFSGAMSEPLCLFTSSMGTFLILLFLEKQQRRYLILAASAAGMAFLTRYVGVFAIAAGLATLLIFNRSPWKARLVTLLLYGLVSLFPNTVWWLYVYQHSSTFGARQMLTQVVLGSASIELRLLLMEVFWSWLPFSKYFVYSYNLSLKILIIFCLFCLILLGLAFWKWWRERRAAWGCHRETIFFLTWCIFNSAYLAFLAYSFIFTTPHPDINPRMLLPVQYGLLIALLSGSLLFLRIMRLPSWVSLVPASLALIFILYNLPASINLVREYHQHGGGYTSISWHQSDTLQALNKLPEGTPIITNQAAAVLLWTDRTAYDFCDPACNQPENARYGDNPDDDVQRIFREQGAALVIFYPFCANRDDPEKAQRIAQIDNLTHGLTIMQSSCNGAIYFYP